MKMMNKNLLKSKRSQDLLTGTIMFLILNVLFFGIMILFVSTTGSGDDLLEKKEVRRIILAIDEMRPGTELIIHAGEVYDAAAKNNFKGEIFSVDYESSILTVRVSSGEGQSYYFSKQLKTGDIGWDDNRKIMIVKI